MGHYFVPGSMFVHGQKVLKRMIISECVISINFTEIKQGVFSKAAKHQTGKTIRVDFYEAAAIIWSNILQASAIIFYRYTVQLLCWLTIFTVGLL